MDRIGWLLKDNLNLLAALGGLVLLLVYYIPTWIRHGRDPDEGVIITRYEPPRGFSPASLRYIRQMYYDDKVMTAAIVNLAVKGYLTIKNEDEVHSVHKISENEALAPMAPGEKELYEALFAEDDEVALENLNHEVLGGARSAHKKSLQQYKKHKK